MTHERAADTWRERALMAELRAESLAERVKAMTPSPATRLAIAYLLTRIGSWTNARWDQHLRHEVGDAAADGAIAWIEESFGVEAFANLTVSDEAGRRAWADGKPLTEALGVLDKSEDKS